MGLGSIPAQRTKVPPKVYVGRWARSLLVEEELRAQDVGVMAELEVEAILDGGWVVT